MRSRREHATANTITLSGGGTLEITGNLYNAATENYLTRNITLQPNGTNALGTLTAP